MQKRNYSLIYSQLAISLIPICMGSFLEFYEQSAHASELVTPVKDQPADTTHTQTQQGRTPTTEMHPTQHGRKNSINRTDSHPPLSHSKQISHSAEKPHQLQFTHQAVSNPTISDHSRGAEQSSIHETSSASPPIWTGPTVGQGHPTERNEPHQDELVKEQVWIDVEGRKFQIEHQSKYQHGHLANQKFQFGTCIVMGTVEPGHEAHLGTLKLSKNSECRNLLSHAGKATENAIKLSCAIAKKFGKSKIALQDDAMLPLVNSPNNNAIEFNASSYSLFVFGKTFYEKYGFKPILNQDISKVMTPDYKAINRIRNMTYNEYYGGLDPEKRKQADRLMKDLDLENLGPLPVSEVYKQVIEHAEDEDEVKLWEDHVLGVNQLKKLDHVASDYVRDC